MREEIAYYTVSGNQYLVKILRKPIKNTYIRLSKDGSYFTLTTSRLTILSSLDTFITSSIVSLLRRREKRNKNKSSSNDLYILGEKVDLTFSNEQERISYFKYNFLPLVTSRVTYYQNLMGITQPYKVGLRNNRYLFGSNSRRTHRLNFTIDLYHYQIEVIDSVVVHELAHHFYFDHSKKFWEVVYKYCPNYKQYRAKLIHTNYGKDN